MSKITKYQINKWLNKCYPLFQDFNSGKWGFETVNGCPNLKEAVYKTRHSAALARFKVYENYAYVALNKEGNK